MQLSQDSQRHGRARTATAQHAQHDLQQCHDSNSPCRCSWVIVSMTACKLGNGYGMYGLGSKPDCSRQPLHAQNSRPRCRCWLFRTRGAANLLSSTYHSTRRQEAAWVVTAASHATGTAGGSRKQWPCMTCNPHSRRVPCSQSPCTLRRQPSCTQRKDRVPWNCI